MPNGIDNNMVFLFHTYLFSIFHVLVADVKMSASLFGFSFWKKFHL